MTIQQPEEHNVARPEMTRGDAVGNRGKLGLGKASTMGMRLPATR